MLLCASPYSELELDARPLVDERRWRIHHIPDRARLYADTLAALRCLPDGVLRQIDPFRLLKLQLYFVLVVLKVPRDGVPKAARPYSPRSEDQVTGLLVEGKVLDI